MHTVTNRDRPPGFVARRTPDPRNATNDRAPRQFVTLCMSRPAARDTRRPPRRRMVAWISGGDRGGSGGASTSGAGVGIIHSTDSAVDHQRQRHRRPRPPAPHRTAPHRTAPHRTAPHRTAPHRTAPHRTAEGDRWLGRLPQPSFVLRSASRVRPRRRPHPGSSSTGKRRTEPHRRPTATKPDQAVHVAGPPAGAQRIPVRRPSSTRPATDVIAIPPAAAMGRTTVQVAGSSSRTPAPQARDCRRAARESLCHERPRGRSRRYHTDAPVISASQQLD
jgi:hypothetical protein